MTIASAVGMYWLSTSTMTASRTPSPLGTKNARMPMAPARTYAAAKGSHSLGETVVTVEASTTKPKPLSTRGPMNSTAQRSAWNVLRK